MEDATDDARGSASSSSLAECMLAAVRRGDTAGMRAVHARTQGGRGEDDVDGALQAAVYYRQFDAVQLLVEEFDARDFEWAWDTLRDMLRAAAQAYVDDRDEQKFRQFHESVGPILVYLQAHWPQPPPEAAAEQERLFGNNYDEDEDAATAAPQPVAEDKPRPSCCVRVTFVLLCAIIVVGFLGLFGATVVEDVQHGFVTLP